MVNEKALELLKDKSFLEEQGKTQSAEGAQRLFAPSESTSTSHITLLKTFCLLGVIFLHAVFPFTKPGEFWRFYADQQSVVAEFLIFWGGFVLIPSFMLASGYLAALSVERRPRSIPAYIAGRAKRLLVPWFLLMVFWMVPLYTFFDIPVYNRPEGYTLAQTYRAGLAGLFADHLWFLLVLFWVSAFFAVVRPVVSRFGGLAIPVLALAAALPVNEYGRALTWYAVWETGGPLVWFGLGSILCRYRDGIGKMLARRPGTLFGLNVVLFVVAAVFGAQATLMRWLTCCLGALAAFQACLYLARRHSRLHGFRLYRYFEDNAFRFYLFHMPGGYLIHRMLAAAGLSSPLPFMLLSFACNLCLTACIVAVFNILEKRLKTTLVVRDKK
ncbi:MAG: acyltransferase [Prevotellaceae bacterium]|jgi:peptidoglycan/LPS O-acetylase OafA/YrhL|nr:acyltransferase [Prevotellaceae bacterium]